MTVFNKFSCYERNDKEIKLFRQTFSEQFDTFLCFTKSVFRQKWNDMQLLLKNIVYATYLTVAERLKT